MPKQTLRTITEVTEALYAVQSYFKNHTGFNRESNLIDKIVYELNLKEDKKVEKRAKELYKIVGDFKPKRITQ